MVLPAKRQPLPYLPAEFHFPFIFQLRLDTSPLPSVPGSSVFRFLFLASQASETDSFEELLFSIILIFQLRVTKLSISAAVPAS